MKNHLPTCAAYLDILINYDSSTSVIVFGHRLELSHGGQARSLERHALMVPFLDFEKCFTEFCGADARFSDFAFAWAGDVSQPVRPNLAGVLAAFVHFVWANSGKVFITADIQGMSDSIHASKRSPNHD